MTVDSVEQVRQAALDNMDVLGNLLAADADAAIQLAEDSPTARNRRTDIGTVFAAIEGEIFLIKGFLVVAAQTGHRHGFSDAEMAILLEKNYVLDSRGHAAAQTRFVRLQDSVRFALSMIAKTGTTPLQVDFSGSEWDEFQQSVAIRHRVAHPKRSADLEISVDDFGMVVRAYRWVRAVVSRTLARALLDAYDEIDELRAARALLAHKESTDAAAP